MGDCPRNADGRRIFTADFKRGVVQQIVKGEETLGADEDVVRARLATSYQGPMWDSRT